VTRKVMKVAFVGALLCLGGTALLLFALGVDVHFMGISFHF